MLPTSFGTYFGRKLALIHIYELVCFVSPTLSLLIDGINYLIQSAAEIDFYY